MGQTADQLRDQIEHQREELGSNLQQLEEKVKSTVDWRTQFEQKPWAGVGVAFAGGFVLSLLMPSGGSDGGGNSSSKSSKMQSSNYMANYRVMDDSQRWGQMGSSGTSSSSSSSPSMGFSSGGSQQKSSSSSPEMSEITETLENIRGAVMGLAATRLRGFLAEAVPGFEDEYEQARTRRGASTSSKIDSSSSSSSGSSGMSSQSQGSSSFASTGSQSGTASGIAGSSMTATTPPSQTHDADTPLAGYMGSTEGTSTSQPNDSYRS